MLTNSFSFPPGLTGNRRRIVLVNLVLILAIIFDNSGISEAESDTPSQSYGPPGYTQGQPLSQVGSDTDCRNKDLAANKRLVMTFYQDWFGNHNVDRLEEYVSPNYIQHNPQAIDGIEGLKQVTMGPAGQGPPMQIDFKRVSAEGDLVWTHSRLPLPGLGTTFAAADIFRIDCQGKVAEHWAVLQDINVESRNDHPFF